MIWKCVTRGLWHTWAFLNEQTGWGILPTAGLGMVPLSPRREEGTEIQGACTGTHDPGFFHNLPFFTWTTEILLHLRETPETDCPILEEKA